MELQEIIGKTLAEIKIEESRLVFIAKTGEVWVMYHSQDCCESVIIEDINGDLTDLVGVPILKAEQVESEEQQPDKPKEHEDSFTWTFYHFATIKGYVTIRWFGSSNGYYSESVSFTRKN